MAPSVEVTCKSCGVVPVGLQPSGQTLRPQVAPVQLAAACVQVAISTVMQIHEQQASGDILLFLTGKGEIDKVCLAA